MGAPVRVRPRSRCEFCRAARSPARGALRGVQRMARPGVGSDRSIAAGHAAPGVAETRRWSASRSAGDSRAAQVTRQARRARGLVDLRPDVEIARRGGGDPELQSCDPITDWHRRSRPIGRARAGSHDFEKSGSQDLTVTTTRILIVDRERPDAAAIEEAAQALRNGKLVVFPTETVYGLGAHALDLAAVRKIFDAKE